MVVEFSNDYLQCLFEGKPVIGKPKFPADVITKFKKTILILQYADSSNSLKKFKGLNFEALKGNLKGYYSVRVDIRYRLIFTINKDLSLTVSEIIVIDELSKHYE